MALSVAISADSPLTAAAGARIARSGGNAVDIAVASALAATVSEVLMCSLGGSAFIMIRLPGKPPELIDGADLMPTVNRSTDAIIDWRVAQLPYGDGIDVMAGHASVGVPGMLAAADIAWQRHGRLPWSEVAAPALELARREIPANATLAKWLALVGRILFYQQDTARGCFFPDGERPLREGEPFRIPDLDRTIEAIARDGARQLYEGDIAATIDQEMKDNGGYVTRDDLAAYQAVVRKPLELNSRGFQLALNPPPAVGGAAVGTLISLLERGYRAEMSASERALLQARAQRELLQVREHQLDDPGFDAEVAYGLFGEKILAQRLAALHSPNTTHISVITGDGAMVAITMSMGYGAGVVISGTGIAGNNSLGEPELNPRGFHALPPGTRFISNMAPTVAWHRDGRCLAFGSPGASRITTSIAQTWARYALEGLDFESAVTAPRLHIEPMPDGLRAQCEPGIDTSRLGSEFIVRPFDDFDMYFGAIKLCALDGEGRLHAVADQRRHGAVEIVEAISDKQ